MNHQVAKVLVEGYALFGGLAANDAGGQDDVAERRRFIGRQPRKPGSRKGEHIGCAGLAAVLEVERSGLLVAGQEDGDGAVAARRRGRKRRLDGGPDDLDSGAGSPQASESTSTAMSIGGDCLPFAARRLLAGLFIGFDDPGDQRMTHDIGAGEADMGDALDRLEQLHRFIQA